MNDWPRALRSLFSARVTHFLTHDSFWTLYVQYIFCPTTDFARVCLLDSFRTLAVLARLPTRTDGTQTWAARDGVRGTD